MGKIFNPRTVQKSNNSSFGRGSKLSVVFFFHDARINYKLEEQKNVYLLNTEEKLHFAQA